MKKLIKKIPIIGVIAIWIKKNIIPSHEFTTSENYWIDRYKKGGNSGDGSYNNLAEFKAEIINKFVSKKKIETVIELGCGDGNQLKYFEFPSYIGFDISSIILEKCREKFKKDKNKEFLHLSKISNHKADLLLSLDVLYHLIEDQIYYNYLNELFDRANLYVIIYANNNDDSGNYPSHVKPRKFTNWINENKQDFQLIEYIPNKFPSVKANGANSSFADFFIYKRNK
jgi:hypothetical protein